MSSARAAEDDPVARFAEVAERFCAWAESPPAAPGSRDAHAACVVLLDLMRTSMDLSETDVVEPKPPSISDDDWRRVFARFEGLSGARLYAAVEPTAPDQGVIWHDLHEDLADLWRDVRECLELHRGGHASAAVHHWRFRFELYSAFHMARMLSVLLTASRAVA